ARREEPAAIELGRAGIEEQGPPHLTERPEREAQLVDQREAQLEIAVENPVSDQLSKVVAAYLVVAAHGEDSRTVACRGDAREPEREERARGEMTVGAKIE